MMEDSSRENSGTQAVGWLVGVNVVECSLIKDENIVRLNPCECSHCNVWAVLGLQQEAWVQLPIYSRMF